MVLLPQEMLQGYSSKLPAMDCLTSLWYLTLSLPFLDTWERKLAQDEYSVGLPTWRLSRASWPGLESPLPTLGSTKASRFKVSTEKPCHSTPGSNLMLLGMRWSLVCLYLLWVHNISSPTNPLSNFCDYSWAAGLSSLKVHGRLTPLLPTTFLLSCSRSYTLGRNSSTEKTSRSLMKWISSRTSKKSRLKCKQQFNVRLDVD